MSFETWLNERSSIMYLLPTFLTFIFYILLMYTSYVIHSSHTKQDECAQTNDNDDGGAQQFLTGIVVIYYLFFILYSNMIVEYRKLKITTHFVLITIWSVLYIGWTGAMGPNDKCKDTDYYSVSQVNQYMGYFFAAVLVIWAIVVLISSLFCKTKAHNQNKVRPLPDESPNKLNQEQIQEKNIKLDQQEKESLGFDDQ